MTDPKKYYRPVYKPLSHRRQRSLSLSSHDGEVRGRQSDRANSDRASPRSSSASAETSPFRLKGPVIVNGRGISPQPKLTVEAGPPSLPLNTLPPSGFHYGPYGVILRFDDIRVQLDKRFQYNNAETREFLRRELGKFDAVIDITPALEDDTQFFVRMGSPPIAFLAIHANGHKRRIDGIPGITYLEKALPIPGFPCCSGFLNQVPDPVAPQPQLCSPGQSGRAAHRNDLHGRRFHPGHQQVNANRGSPRGSNKPYTNIHGFPPPPAGPTSDFCRMMNKFGLFSVPPHPMIDPQSIHLALPHTMQPHTSAGGNPGHPAQNPKNRSLHGFNPTGSPVAQQEPSCTPIIQQNNYGPVVPLSKPAIMGNPPQFSPLRQAINHEMPPSPHVVGEPLARHVPFHVFDPAIISCSASSSGSQSLRSSFGGLPPLRTTSSMKRAGKGRLETNLQARPAINETGLFDIPDNAVAMSSAASDEHSEPIRVRLPAASEPASSPTTEVSSATWSPTNLEFACSSTAPSSPIDRAASPITFTKSPSPEEKDAELAGRAKPLPLIPAGRSPLPSPSILRDTRWRSSIRCIPPTLVRRGIKATSSRNGNGIYNWGMGGNDDGRDG